MPHEAREESWEKFEATDPRCHLIDGYLYFREEDVKKFICSGNFR